MPVRHIFKLCMPDLFQRHQLPLVQVVNKTYTTVMQELQMNFIVFSETWAIYHTM